MLFSFQTLLLAFSIAVVRASASTDDVLWLKFQESAIVKLETPGYPLWIMDKANAPMLYKDAENFYFATDAPSAVLLNLTMSHDKKTLLVNHQPVLPFADYNVPPMIDAYQVPAAYSRAQVKGIVDMGLTKDWYWKELTTAWRYLQLDYDRLVWADPYTGPWQNHHPRLTFRLMGLGAHSRNDVLDVQEQKVLQVTLTDSNHGSSTDSKRSYGITNIEIKEIEESYAYAPATEPEQKQCTVKSWLCPDQGLYQDVAPPPYRFIWRSRFDQYGRIGSQRHAIYRKTEVLRKMLQEAGPSMLLSFGILMSISMVILTAVFGAKKWMQRKARDVRDLAEDDRLIGEYEEKYFDELEEAGELPPPLPPRPGQGSRGHILVDIDERIGQ